MSREKDGAKRQAILEASGRLFAERGYYGTSVADIAREIAVPVGSIYTYFPSKDAVLMAVVELGWEEFLAGMRATIDAAPSPEARLDQLVSKILPSLFQDADLITILLSEVGRGGLDAATAGLNDKLGRLAEIIGGVIEPLASRLPAGALSARDARTAIAIFFLGSLSTVRLARSAGLEVSDADIVSFIKTSVTTTFGIELSR